VLTILASGAVVTMIVASALTFLERGGFRPVAHVQPGPFPDIGRPPPPIATTAEGRRIQEFLRSLRPGQIAHDIPRHMVWNERVRVTVRVAAGTVDVSGLMNPQTAPLKNAPVMSVELVGAKSDFLIEPESSTGPRAIDLMAKNGAAWVWEVTPLKTGERRLTVRASAKTGDAALDLPLYSVVVVVTVTPWQWTAEKIRENWQFVTTTFAIPVWL
jgi:hypothetical protein